MVLVQLLFYTLFTALSVRAQAPPAEQDCQANFINCENEDAARDSWINANVTNAMHCFRDHWTAVRDGDVQFDIEVARYFGYTQGPSDFQCDVTPTSSCEAPEAAEIVCREYFRPDENNICDVPSTYQRAAGLLILRAMANFARQMEQAYEVLDMALGDLSRTLDEDNFRNVFLPDVSTEASTRSSNAARAGIGGGVGIAGAAVAGYAGTRASPVTAGVAGVVGAVIPAIIGVFNALQAGEAIEVDIGPLLQQTGGSMRDSWADVRESLYTTGTVTPENGEELSLLDDIIEPSEGGLATLQNLNEVDSEMAMPIRRMLTAAVLLEGWMTHLRRFPFVTFANDVGDAPCDGSGLPSHWETFRHESTDGELSSEYWEDISVKMDNRCYYLLGAEVMSSGRIIEITEDEGYVLRKRQWGGLVFEGAEPEQGGVPDNVCAWTTLPGATKSRLHGRDGMHDGLTLESMIRAVVELWHQNDDVNRMEVQNILDSGIEIPIDVGPAGSIVGVPVCDYITDRARPGEGCPRVFAIQDTTCGVFSEESTE